MRSAPTSRGLSVRIGIPVRVPGSTTTGGKLKYRCTISRSAVVALGTTDAITTPVIWFVNDSPACSSSAPNPTAISSAARPGRLEGRGVHDHRVVEAGLRRRADLARHHGDERAGVALARPRVLGGLGQGEEQAAGGLPLPRGQAPFPR